MLKFAWMTGRDAAFYTAGRRSKRLVGNGECVLTGDEQKQTPRTLTSITDTGRKIVL